MKAKRIFQPAVLVLVAVFLFASSAVAADNALVYADKIGTKPNSIFFVPVNIKGNPGLMGFKLTVSYDKEVLSLPVVTRGTVTQGGMLNDSIGITDEGTFDVVWTNDSAVANDGTLLVLSFNVDDTDEKNTTLKLSYSQADTFDESYNDVVFDCKEIAISFTDEDVLNEYSGEIKEPGYKDVIVAVDSAIKDMPFDSIKNVDRDFDPEILESVNETIKIMTGTENYFSSVDEIIGAYKAAAATDFINTSVEAVDPGVIDDVIGNAVQSVGAESLEEIPAEKKAEFVDAVEKNLQEQASDIDIISDTLTEDEAIDAIKSLQSTNEENQSTGKKVFNAAQNSDNLFTKIIIAVAAAVVVIFAVLALIIRKKQKKN